MLDKTCNIVSLPLGTNRYLKSGMHVTVSGPISDTGRKHPVLYLLPPWFRTVIPELEGIQEESPDRLVKTQLRGGGGGVCLSLQPCLVGICVQLLESYKPTYNLVT